MGVSNCSPLHPSFVMGSPGPHPRDSPGSLCRPPQSTARGACPPGLVASPPTPWHPESVPFSLFVLSWGSEGRHYWAHGQRQRAHQELTRLQMALASSENLWEYTSSDSSTRRSTSSRFTFSLRPRNGDWPSIIS